VKVSKSNLNVLILAQYFPPDLGGSATRAYNVAKGLILNECNVTVVTAFPHYPHGDIPKEYRWKPFKVEWMGRIRVIRTFMPPLKSEGFFKRLLLLASFAVSAVFALPVVGRFDVVWASSWAPGVFYSRVKRRKLVLNVDDLTIKDVVDLGLLREGSMLVRVGRLAYKVFYVQGDAVTPISPGYVERIMEYGVKKEKICPVRGGVDLETFRLAPRQRDDKFTVLYSGAFSVAYDFEQILRAADVLRKEKRDDVVFVIQGAGELGDQIRSSVEDLKLKNVAIINKIVSRGEVAELLNGADALILPLADFGRPYLGISSKLYEYQAVGKPIICCAYGEPADYVEETKSGIVVKPGDYESLARAVLYLKNNPGLADSFGESGRKYVDGNVSIEKIGLEMKDLLIRLIEMKEARV
jgi:glycosyltransferase involved in cell wall biosynthesis